MRYPMRNTGIASRLVIAFGSLLALMAVFGGFVVFAARAIHGDLEEITSIAQPISAASYEMEINAIGAGLGVVKYLHRPHPEYRARFEKDKADFERFLARYRNLARDAEHLALADTLAAAYREYSELGEALMALRDRQSVRRGELAQIATQFDRFDAENPIHDDAPIAEQGMTNARLAFALAADMAEIFLFVASGREETDAVRGDGRAGQAPSLERKIASARKLLRQLAELRRTPAEAPWFARLSGLFERAIALAQEIVTAETAVERDLLKLIALRTRIDGILDDKIQVLAGNGLFAANADAEERIEQTYWLLSAIAILGVLVAGAAILILSRTIVGPIRQLAEAARGVSTGNLACRADVAGGGDLGELGRAFNHMTESLESALNTLNQSNVDLEAQVAMRTSALATTNRQLEDELAQRAEREQALRLAKEAAEVANRGKTVFLANMSHELRTPLNAVIGFAHLMRMELLGPIGNEKYGDYIKDIHESAQNLLRLINDILDISKVETGNVKLREEWLDIANLAGRSADLVGWRVRGNGLLVSVEVAPGLPRLWADELRMKQILINLLDNAIKFSHRGGKIVLAAAVTAHGDLQISVSDNGIGIAPENFDKVLTIFGQADSGLDRSYEGAGLGLPLVKAFVELHGGELTLESALGQGTRMAVTLPRERLEPPRQATAS